MNIHINFPELRQTQRKIRYRDNSIKSAGDYLSDMISRLAALFEVGLIEGRA